MRLTPQLSWTLDGDAPEPLDVRLLPLLEAIAATATLGAAATAAALSYRAAWGLLRDYGERLGTPLATLERGRGARLAPAGEALLRAHVAATRRAAPVLGKLAVDIGAPLARADRIARSASLRIAASHDLALAALRAALPAAGDLQLDLTFKGSLEALADYADGRVQLAGFHVPIGRGAARDRAAFLRWLRPSRDRLIRFVDREQGLILPSGNPRRVKSFRDVVAKRLRFVNRQRGSGTRLLVDSLLARGHIDPSDMAGYATEEFTHPAVAAAIAAGTADVGFGVQAAAAQYGLGFVPVVRERYFFALRAALLHTPGVEALVALLRGPVLASLVARLPGYDCEASGSVGTIRTLAVERPAG